MKKLNALLTFRCMITPWIIQVVFWLSLLLCIFAGFSEMIKGHRGVVFELIAILVGILLARVMAEVFIISFRINETLTDIKNLIEDKVK